MKKNEYKKSNFLKKIIKNVPNIFYFIFSLVFSIILILNIIYNNTSIVKLKLLELLLYNDLGIKKINIIFLIIFTLIIIVIGYFIYHLIDKKIKNKQKFIRIMWLIFIIFQISFAYVFLVKPSWDFGNVFLTAANSAVGKDRIYNNLYYYRYGNNLGCVLLLRTVFWFFSIFSTNTKFFLAVAVVLNILLINISILFLYKTIKLVFDEKLSTFFLICSFLFLPLTAYTPIFYSDTLSMPFLICAMYFFVEMIFDKEYNWKKFIIIGLMLGFGSTIKFTVIILLISIIIFLVLNEQKLTKLLKYCTLMIIFMLIPLSTTSIYKSQFMNQKLLKEEEFPLTHWIMMGLKVNKWGVPGGYDEEDVWFTDSFNNVHKKKEENIKEIKRRVKDRVKDGSIFEFYARKIVFVWGDGTFFAPNVLERQQVHDFKIKKIILGNEKQTFVYRSMSQASMIIIILSFILSCIYRKHLDEKQQKILLLNTVTIFGVFLFFLIWEARSRYLVNFIPIFLLQVFLGVVAINNKIKTKKKVV